MGQILGGIEDIFGGISQGQQQQQDMQGLNQINTEILGNNAQLGSSVGNALGWGNSIGGNAFQGYGSLAAGINGYATAPGSVGAEYQGAQKALTSGMGDISAGIGDATQAGNYYSGLMKNGLDPAVRAAAYSGFNTQTAQADANMKANYTGPNAAGLLEDANFQNISGRAQLGGNLAAQDQSAREAGAAGVAGVGQEVGQLGQAYSQLGMDKNTLGLQSLGMLGAYSQGEVTQGAGLVGQQNAPLQAIGGEYAGAASQAGANANADWQGAASGIGGGIANMATGGFANFLNPGMGGNAMGYGGGFGTPGGGYGGYGANGGIDQYGQYSPYAVTPT